MFDVVLINPEIPPNTGNIGRLTLGSRCGLTVVGEPSFDLSDDAAVNRAGLDYWDQVNLNRFENWPEYKTSTSGSYHLISKFARTPYHRANFEPGDQIIFGGETKGAPQQVHDDPLVQSHCIPMSDAIRAFNVCNAAAVVLFEALRQNDPDWFSETPFSGQSPQEFYDSHPDDSPQ
ncbi:MAG: tRNA (cytidine(34)-2'-O)-methyltransferase [bacterium]